MRRAQVVQQPSSEALGRINATQAAHYREYLAEQVRAQTALLKALESKLAATDVAASSSSSSSSSVEKTVKVVA